MNRERGGGQPPGNKRRKLWKFMTSASAKSIKPITTQCGCVVLHVVGKRGVCVSKEKSLSRRLWRGRPTQRRWRSAQALSFGLDIDQQTRQKWNSVHTWSQRLWIFQKMPQRSPTGQQMFQLCAMGRRVPAFTAVEVRSTNRAAVPLITAAAAVESRSEGGEADHIGGGVTRLSADGR